MNHSIVFGKNAGSGKQDFQPDSGPDTVAVIEKQHIPERSTTVKPRKGAFFLQRNPEGGSYRYEYVAGLLKKVEKKNADDTAWQTLESYEYQFTPVKKTSKTQYDDAGAITTTTTYDSAGRVSEVVDTAGRINQQIIYDDQYLMKTVKNRLPNAKLDSIVYQNNPLGLVEAVTMISSTGESATEQYVYDAKGRKTKTTDIYGIVSETEYNDDENSVKQIKGIEWTKSYYDALNRLKRTELPTGGTIDRNYMLNGLLESIVQSNGRISAYQYDSFLNVVQLSDNGTGRTAITNIIYDGFTKEVNIIVDGKLMKAIEQRNMNGNVTARISVATDGTEEIRYTDRFFYDTLGQLQKTVDRSGMVTDYAYSLQGMLKQKTVNSTRAWNYDYNTKWQLWKVHGPSVSGARLMTEYAYSPEGKVSHVSRDNAADVVDIVHDYLGRLTDYATNNGINIEYEYLNNSGWVFRSEPNRMYAHSLNKEGRISQEWLIGEDDYYLKQNEYDKSGCLIRLSSWNSEIRTSYDDFGLKKSEMTEINDVRTFTKRYEYTPGGLITRFTSPSNKTTEYFYNEMGRPTEIAHDGKSVFYTYNSLGIPVLKELPNGLTERYVYENGSRLHSIETDYLDTTEVLAYGYNGFGEVTSRTLTKGNTVGTDTFSYYNNGRINQAQYMDEFREIFSYDGAGRRVQMSSYYSGSNDSYRRRNYEYGTGSLLNKVTEFKFDGYGGWIENGNTEYFYTNGRLTSSTENYSGSSKKIKTFSYEGNGKLEKFSDGYNKFEEILEYDPYDRVLMKRKNDLLSGSSEVLYFLSDDEDIITETDVNGNILKEYVHGMGIDEPLWSVSNNEERYYHTDMLGSVTHLTNENGETTDLYSYRAFGEANHTNVIQSADIYYGKTEYGFTGRINNELTGLMDYRSRQYDPNTGRFTQYDMNPVNLMYGGEIDLYNTGLFDHFAYVGYSPLNGTDPFGWSPFKFDPIGFSQEQISRLSAAMNFLKGEMTNYGAKQYSNWEIAHNAIWIKGRKNGDAYMKYYKPEETEGMVFNDEIQGTFARAIKDKKFKGDDSHYLIGVYDLTFTDTSAYKYSNITYDGAREEGTVQYEFNNIEIASLIYHETLHYIMGTGVKAETEIRGMHNDYLKNNLTSEKLFGGSPFMDVTEAHVEEYMERTGTKLSWEEWSYFRREYKLLDIDNKLYRAYYMKTKLGYPAPGHEKQAVESDLRINTENPGSFL